MSRGEFKVSNRMQGQAVIEYLLVLIVVIGIAQYLYLFNKSFRAWADDYFVEYYKCLLETGESPGIGGGEVGVCAQEYKPFEIDPSQLNSGGSGKGGGSGDSGTETSDSGRGGGTSGSDGSGRDGDGDSSEDRGAEVSRVAGAGGGSGGGQFGRFKTSDGKSDAGDDASRGKSDGSKDYTGSTETTNFSSNSSTLVKRERSDLDRDFASVMEKEERGKEKSKSTNITKQGVREEKKERFKVSAQVKREIAEENEDSFTIGGFLRFLLIVAIIIAILFLVGSQLYQVSKNLDAE